jgi:zinc transport system permease protein
METEIGKILADLFFPIFEYLSPHVPGEFFPNFFNGETQMLQRSLLGSLMVTIIAGFLGSFLLVRNLAMIGDGLAHVAFGGVIIGIILGATTPLWYALLFSIIASISIYELQSREILTGDASIAIFMTGMLALGLVILKLSGRAITTEIHGYLFGSQLLIDWENLNLISYITISSLVMLFFLRHGLLAITVDPLSARVQGLPVRKIGLMFSIIIAIVVVSMVKVVGALLVTALLVTPAATAQLIGRSFKSCIVLTQIFGFLSLMIGIYFSAEHGTGTGSSISLVAATMFVIIGLVKSIIINLNSKKNVN